jgi:1,3,6,8-tetrahydroxynaphthalene synthase
MQKGGRMALICRPGEALPDYRILQEEYLEAARLGYEGDVEHLERKLSLMAHTSVKQRYFVKPLDALRMHEGVPRRVDQYLEWAPRLALRAINQALVYAGLQALDICALICTSCTSPGLLLPGLDASIVAAGGFPNTIRRLPIAQMGCHAGVTALAQAHAYLLGHPDEHVLVCCVELCSLNEQPADLDASSFVSRGLFGDGATAAVVRGDDRGTGVRILATGQYLVPDTLSDMCYELDELGNHFRTKREVVPGLKKGFPAIHAFLSRSGYQASDLDFLVSHTGGPRVMDAVVEALGVPEQFIAASRESLREVGNLSSAAVLDVLARTFEDRYRPSAESIGLMLGFGPGSTIEMLLGRWQEGELS